MTKAFSMRDWIIRLLGGVPRAKCDEMLNELINIGDEEIIKLQHTIAELQKQVPVKRKLGRPRKRV